MGGACPYFPAHSSPVPHAQVASTRLWSRPSSVLLPDYPHYCTMGSGMIPSSKVPTWKVCLLGLHRSDPPLFLLGLHTKAS